MLVEVEQIGIGFCCLILYIIALAEYAESERAKRVGREGVVGGNEISSSLLAKTKYSRRFSASLSLSMARVDEFGSCYIVGYCDV